MQSPIMAKACEVCTSVAAVVKKPRDGVNVAQRKKNLGLLTAAYVGHNGCMKVFISKGADVNCFDQDFDWDCRRKLCRKIGVASEANYMNYGDRLKCLSPLISAAVHNRLECLRLLVKSGADVNLTMKRRTALGAAAEKGHHDGVELLIELGANVNVADQTIRPALICAIHAKSTMAHIKCIEILIKSGADVNTIYSNPYGESTPLQVAANNSTPEVASLLIKAGADVNMGTILVFPLYLAILRGRFKMAKVLTDAGADVNKRNDDGETALHASLKFFSQGCFNLMMKLGADVNISSDTGVTPLMKAARSCRRLQLMMNDQQSMVAIKTEKVRGIRRIIHLLKAGAEINRLDHLGRNSLQFSIEENQRNVKEIHMLLYAAGETLDGPTVPADDFTNGGIKLVSIPEYLQELKENLDLKHLCREAIRKHLIYLDPHVHLFGRIPQLGLPSLVTEYLLYDCSLDYRRAADCENEVD